MRHLISSLQNHNHQLKGEVLRYKRKLREAQSDLNKVTGSSGISIVRRSEGEGGLSEEAMCPTEVMCVFPGFVS